MKKNIVTISELKNTNQSYSLTLNNVELCRKYTYIFVEIIRSLIAKEELFFGFYKSDGIYISKSEHSKYKREIFEFFKDNGEYIELAKQPDKCISLFKCTRELIGCKSSKWITKESFLDIFEKICLSYLETIFFSPNISWNMFIESYKNYTNISVKDYVMNGYTDFLFSHTDSGDFSITFNPNLYDVLKVREQVLNIIRKTGDIIISNT